MSNVIIPKLKFSTWYAWKNREQYRLIAYPGVYAISISASPHLEGQEARLEDVSYIGMTRSKNGLRGRWRHFDRAIQGKGRHSGGKTIFKDKGHYSDWSEYLYVAAMGIECDVSNPTDEDYVKMGQVTYLEYKAFAEYFRQVGGHPKYNKL